MTTRSTLRKVFAGGAIVTGLLTVVLFVHIYMVTHKSGGDATRIAMARIDFDQDISEADAQAITAWLYQQQGIDHVLCNPETDIAVFTFLPATTNANDITNKLCNTTPYKGKRYLPSREEMMTGCPVAAGSLSGKISSLIRRL